MATPMCLAETTFSSGANDKLATADVYDVSSTTTINSVEELTSEAITTNAEQLRNSNATSYQALISEKLRLASSTDTTTSDVKERLNALGTDVSANLRNLSGTNLTSIVSSVTSSDAINSVTASVNGVSSLVSSSSISDVLSIGKLINSIGCDVAGFILSDLSALAGLFSGIINAASKLGISNIFGQMMSCRTDKTLINQVANSTLSSTIASSDVDSLLTMSQITSTGSIAMCTPDAIEGFSSNYSAASGLSLTDENNNLSKIISSYDNIDSSWNTSTRKTTSGTESIISLASLTNGSTSFKTLLTNGAKSGVLSGSNSLLALASVFSKTSVASQVGNSFSSTALSSSYSSSSISNPISLFKNLVS